MITPSVASSMLPSLALSPILLLLLHLRIFNRSALSRGPHPFHRIGWDLPLPPLAGSTPPSRQTRQMTLSTNNNKKNGCLAGDVTLQ